VLINEAEALSQQLFKLLEQLAEKVKKSYHI